MREELTICGIPALLWGEKSDQGFVFVHGKQGCKEDAALFAGIAERYGNQTLSFDLPEHGGRRDAARCDVFCGVREVNRIADAAFARWKRVSLFANSLGAYFSLQGLADRPFERALFQSPIVDMEWLVRQMFAWFHVTEAQLEARGEIPTPVDPLRWDYWQYIREHPVTRWPIPTAILYGGRDNLQPREAVRAFAKAHGCRLTVSEDSEHPFMAAGDLPIVRAWMEGNVRG